MARSTATMYARSGASPSTGGALPVSRRDQLAHRRNELRQDVAAVGNVMPLVWVFVGFIVVVTIAAKFIAPIFTATADVNEALNDENVTTGDASADSIKPVFGIVIGLAVVIGIVTLILASVKFGKGR